jgi:hypothetical protein
LFEWLFLFVPVSFQFVWFLNALDYFFLAAVLAELADKLVNRLDSDSANPAFQIRYEA